MRWKVEVYGHEFDLTDLVKAAGGVGAKAFTDEGRTFLYAEAFEQMDGAAKVHDAAQALIATVQTALKLSDSAAQLLTVGPVIDATGKASRIVSGAGTIQARSRAEGVLVTVGGDAASPPPTEPILARRTRLIATNAEVAEAVELLNNSDKTLVSLAKAYEIVKGDLGHGNHKLGGKKAATISGVSEEDLLAFMENVNYPALSGGMSRHAGKNTKREPEEATRKMSHAEATSLIRQVVLAWIDAKG